jgi:hypothetical protein
MTTWHNEREAIRELLHRYCFCLDAGRFTELAALFTADGEWVAPYHSAKGPTDIAAWLLQSVPGHPRRMHYVMNSIIDCDDTSATAQSNYLVMIESPNGPQPSVCGTYDDALVKQPDGWRFKRRRLIHAFSGEMALRLT